MVQPLNSFCCGCPLETGVRLCLSLHLITSIFYMLTCLLNIVVGTPTIGHGVDEETQAFNCGFALASLPFIAAGFSGVIYEIDIHLRIYLFWLLITVGMDFVLYAFVLFKNSCVTIPEFLVESGGAFTCGFMRLAGTFFILMFLIMWGYLAFTVWSRCEELEIVGTDRAFSELSRQRYADPEALVRQHKGGLFGVGPALLQPARPIVYGSLATQAYGGSATIFGGCQRKHRHDSAEGDIH